MLNLRLSSNQISNVAMQQLCDALGRISRLTQLQLDFEGMHLGDDGLYLLGEQLKRNRRLRFLVLTLSYNKFREKGTHYLC